MSVIGKIVHVFKRFIGSFDYRPISQEILTEVSAMLTQDEFALWNEMRLADRRHSVIVLKRFRLLRPDSCNAERAGALLHDVGKTVSDLGLACRVVATVIGPRGSRFRDYHDHEQLGAELVSRITSDPLTVLIVGGNGPEDVMSALSRADNY